MFQGKDHPIKIDFLSVRIRNVGKKRLSIKQIFYQFSKFNTSVTKQVELVVFIHTQICYRVQIMSEFRAREILC